MLTQIPALATLPANHIPDFMQMKLIVEQCAKNVTQDFMVPHELVIRTIAAGFTC